MKEVNILAKKIRTLMYLVLVGLITSCSGNKASNNIQASPTLSSAAAENKNSPQPLPTSTTSENNQPISITAPADNEQVVGRPFVEGTVLDSTAKVWVIVHPMEVSDYWIQPPVTMREGGKWKVQVHIGRPGPEDIGKHFEIMAVANAKNNLKEGDKLRGWPDAKWKSQVVEVIRK
jgi:hypothetical protein